MGLIVFTIRPCWILLILSQISSMSLGLKVDTIIFGLIVVNIVEGFWVVVVVDVVVDGCLITGDGVDLIVVLIRLLSVWFLPDSWSFPMKLTFAFNPLPTIDLSALIRIMILFDWEVNLVPDSKSVPQWISPWKSSVNRISIDSFKHLPNKCLFGDFERGAKSKSTISSSIWLPIGA